jgi:hypothetical protein
MKTKIKIFQGISFSHVESLINEWLSDKTKLEIISINIMFIPGKDYPTKQDQIIMTVIYKKGLEA